MQEILNLLCRSACDSILQLKVVCLTTFGAAAETTEMRRILASNVPRSLASSIRVTGSEGLILLLYKDR